MAREGGDKVNATISGPFGRDGEDYSFPVVLSTQDYSALTDSSKITFRDSPNLDAFARLRVSAPYLLLDTKRVGSAPDVTMTNSVSGSGAVAYQSNRASTYLTVGTAVGTAVRQTKSRAVYQPGKSMLVFETFVLAPAQTNLRQRVGLFDAKNGIFFQLDDAELSMNIRSFVTGSAVDLKAARSAWNLDKLDGTGSSGKTLDVTKPQILIIDLEWLGVGRVRTGFVLDGCPCYVHEFLNANNTHTSVYMSNPNLPVRWEIEAKSTVTGTPTLEAICGSASDVNAAGSVMEKNTTRTVTAGTGLVIASGYVSSNQNSITALDRPVLTFGTTLAGVTDVFSLQVTNLSASGEGYLGGLTWREIF